VADDPVVRRPPASRPPPSGRQDWPRCRPAGDADCTGVQVPPYGRCLEHLTASELDETLSHLSPGADLDARGTHVSDHLLDCLLSACSDGESGPVFGTVQFSEASFDGNARFSGASFDGMAWFNGVRFGGDAVFRQAQFGGNAWFSGACFAGTAWFDGVRFGQAAVFRRAQFQGAAWFTDSSFDGTAWFEQASFAGDALFSKIAVGVDFTENAEFGGVQFGSVATFGSVRFGWNASFGGARFGGDASFNDAAFGADARYSGTAGFDAAQFSAAAGFWGTRFGGDASFGRARFQAAGYLGPFVVDGRLSLDAAVFEHQVTIEAATAAVSARRASFAGATLRLRYADVDLSHAVSTSPLAVIAAAGPFTIPGAGEEEPGLLQQTVLAQDGRDPGPSLLSIRGMDASQVFLVDVDLSRCRFADAYNLDQLRFEGSRCRFAEPPRTLRIGRGLAVWRYTRRQVLAEERDWRGQRRRPGWIQPDEQQVPALDPERILTLYRQLRKAQEDAKNEPGAADFYYGEMEMRRYARTTPTGERVVLALYWALSGYGLRSTRALSALLVVLALATAGFVTVGFAAAQNVQYLPIGHPRPGLPAAYQQAIAPGPRPGWLAALNYSVDSSTSLLSKGQSLPVTWAGNVVEFFVKLAAPLLLGLALLAVRNRVKR
jgi:hypothetical protein